MRKIFVFLFAILIIPAYAREQAYSGWVSSGSTVTLDNNTYNILLSALGDAIIFQDDDDYESIDLTNCRKVGFREICFNESEKDDDGDYSALVTIYNLKPYITLNRTISKEKVDVGETLALRASIKNSGDVEASDVYFIEDLPDGLVVKESDNCIIRGNEVYWKGDIDAGEEHVCEYEIYAKEELDTKITASASYFNGFDDIVTYSSSSRIYTNEILTVKSYVQKSEINPDEVIEFYYNITNNAVEKLEDIKATVIVPLSLIVDESGPLKYGNSYIWEGDLDINKTKKLYFKLRGKNIGTSTITLDIEYNHLNQDLEKTGIKDSILVEQEGITLTSGLADGRAVDTNQDFRYTLIVRNDNTGASISNIVANISSNIGYFGPVSIQSIEANGSRKLYDLYVKAPTVNATTNYYINAEVKYESEFGDQASEKLSRKVTVYPIGSISLTKTVNPNPVDENAEATVELRVKNNLNQKLDDVEIKEYIPSELTVIGQTSAVKNLNAGEEILAYSYKLKMPTFLMSEQVYHINSSVTYTANSNDYENTAIVSLRAKPKAVNLYVSKKASESSIKFGENVEITYVLENRDSSTISRIKLYYSADSEFDTLNYKSMDIAKIDPGEKLSIGGEKIRAKSMGNPKLGGSYVTYYDNLGRNYTKVIDELTFTVKDGLIDFPLILAYKSGKSNFVNNMSNITVLNTITNIGASSSSVTVIDGDKSWQAVVPSGKSMNLSYTLSMTGTGRYVIGPSKILYSYDGNEYYSLTNGLDIAVNEAGVASVTSQSGTETGSPSSQAQELSNIYKKSLLRKFFDWIKSLFGVN